MHIKWGYKNLELFDFTTIVLLVFTILASYVVWKWACGRKYRLPPGPMGLPIVGFYPFLTKKDPQRQLFEMRKKYGPLVSMYLGSRLVVVLLDFPVLKEAFNRESFLARPPATAFTLVKDGVSFNDLSGNLWKASRKFTMHILRDLGYGKSVMEGHIQNEIQELLSRLAESKGKVVDSRKLLASSVSNVISTLIFGRRLDHNDPQRRFLDQFLFLVVRYFKQTSVHAIFPWLMKTLVFFRVGKYDQVKETLERFFSFVDDEIAEHRKNVAVGHTRDYIDGYIKELDGRKDAEKEGFSVTYLKGNIRSMFAAGSEGSRTTLEWCLMTMAGFPEYQKRIQKEIDEQIGGQRIPSTDDLPRTPLTHAAILEVLRWTGLSAFGIVRLVTCDEKLMGYDIPKGSVAMANIWGIHRDPDLWDDPMTFKPERFISEDGIKVHKPEYFIPFAYGRRSCPGENLAYVELYLYLASILQKFEVLPPEGKQNLFEQELTISLQLIDTRMRFVERNRN